MDEPTAPEVPGYHLGALLGRGSSARVYAGRRLADGRPVAVKVCLGVGADDAAVRELGALQGVGGEHVVRLLEAVPLADALALVMERLDGGTLGQVVQARGQLTAGEVVTVMSPLAAALGGLHRAGVVHGDVSPGNVLFDETGRPALCDLGVSRIVGEQVREVWGTAGFVAPEVLLGALPSPASDMYSVGALGWFAATGQPPGPSWLREEAEDPGPDPALAAVLGRCLATDPAERPDGVEASLALYEAAPAEPLLLPGHGEGVDSLTRRIRAAAQVLDTDRPAGTSSRWRRWPRRAGGRVAGPTPVRQGQGPSARATPSHLGRGLLARTSQPPRQVDGPGAAGVAAVAAAGARPVRRRVPGALDSSQPERGRPRHARSRRRRAVSGGVVAVLAGVFVTLGALVAVAAGWSPVDPMPRAAAATPAAAAPTVDARSLVGSLTPSSAALTTSAARANRPTGPSSTPSPTRATRATRATRVTPVPSQTSAPRALSATRPADVLSRRTSLPGKPVAVAQALCDARARVWSAEPPARLTDVDAPGSAALGADETALRDAAAGGWRYSGVGFTVRESTVEGEVTTTATVRVVLDAAAYTVTGPKGRQTRPAATGTVLRLGLVWTAVGWRVGTVSPG